MSYLQRRIAERQRTAPRPVTMDDSIPAPILGWNARDPLSDMDPRFALVLDNIFPDGNDVRLRPGNVEHTTGFPSFVETLHTAAFGSTRKLVAFSGANAYDSTGGGTIGAPLATGFTNSRWIGANAGVSPGERAIYTNGVDAAQAYDGTTMTSAGLTGPANPNGITVANKRIWTTDEGTGDAWYWPLEAVTGAGAKFSIGSVVPDGGDLIAISTLTLDGGNGPEDATIFVMRSGRLVVYSGTDPSDAANWALRGVWKTGRPIGNRCLVPYDKDVILICETGFESVLAFTTGGGVAGVPISDNIRRAVSDASLAYENNFGWNGLFNPHTRQLIFNIPIIENRTSEQYVMNAVDPRRPWCRFKGVNLFCQAAKDHERFVGVDQKVLKADTGGTDLGEPIMGNWQSAWNYFRPRGREKFFNQFRPHVRSDRVLDLGTGVGTDFRDPKVSDVGGTSAASGAEWNVSPWNQDPWAGGVVNQRPWLGAANKGFNASVVIRVQTSNVVVQFLATDVLYEVGSPL